MNATSILCWALAWSVAGGAVLLVTACLVRRLPYASVRHLAWVMAVACVAVLPLLPLADWVVRKSATTRLDRDPKAVGGEVEGRTCVPAPTSGSTRHPLSSLALCGWLAGTAWTLGRAALALRTVDRWRRRSEEYRLPAGLPMNSFEKVAVRIAQEDVPLVPIMSGFRRPIILLPRSAASWDESRITAILWHELGHVRRGDNLSQLLALLIHALHWFNPVFWFAARRMEAEAEMAADDFAILRGVRPSSYAAELLAVASELRSGAWKFPMAHTAMVKAFTLEDRLRSIVDPRSRRGTAPMRAYGTLAGAFAALGIALILLTPRLATWLEPRTEAAGPACHAPGQPNF